MVKIQELPSYWLQISHLPNEHTDRDGIEHFEWRRVACPVGDKHSTEKCCQISHRESVRKERGDKEAADNNGDLLPPPSEPKLAVVELRVAHNLEAHVEPSNLSKGAFYCIGMQAHSLWRPLALVPQASTEECFFSLWPGPNLQSFPSRCGVRSASRVKVLVSCRVVVVVAESPVGHGARFSQEWCSLSELSMLVRTSRGPVDWVTHTLRQTSSGQELVVVCTMVVVVAFGSSA